MLVLVAALLAIQPVGRLARADEPAPALFSVVGVAAATLRAEPNGSSIAVALVPAGSVLSQAGADVVTAGVTWRQVRTAEGHVGFVPAGLLASAGGGAPTSEASAGLPASGLSAGPAASAGTAPAQSVGSAPAESVGSGAAATASAASSQADGAAPSQLTPEVAPGPANAVSGGPTAAGGSAAQPSPTPAPAPAPPTVRTTVENRRGQDVTITQIDEATAPDGRPMGAGRIVVGFRTGVSEQGQQAAHRAAGTKATRGGRLAGMTVAEVEPGAVQQALAAYRGRSDVAWAEPDYVHRATLTTTDPMFGSQWGLIKIGTPIAWDVTTGAEKNYIAILDSGVYSDTSSTWLAPDGLPGHPDLRGRVVLNANFTSAVTGTDDWYGHGTLMAGIAGARTNTSPADGIAGVGFDAKLFNGKVLDDTGSGFESWVADGIVWAADSGAKVISMSLGAPGPCSQTLQTAVNYAWARNIVIVAAAGNGGMDQVGDPASESPGNCAHVVSVGAIDQGDARASFSNYGPGVPLAAPGVSVLSTNFIGTYSTVSGTSPATPHVAGVAALLFSTPFAVSNQAIVNRLFQSADPIVGTGAIWGYGRLNAAAAVGPASCSPRPKVTITSTPNGAALNVAAVTQGVGNAVRYIQVGAAAGGSTNALVSFPTQPSQSGGTATYVPQTVGTAATFQVQRQTAGLPTTLPFIVTDGCGGWNSLAGGGPAAGF